MPKKRTAAIIQARMGSTRLPGKVLMSLGDRPCLRHVVERVQRAKLVDKVIVATTTNTIDQTIVDYCGDVLKVGVYRGSENDVIGRVIRASQVFNIDTIVDITADCPLVDPEHIDLMINKLRMTSKLYVSNAMQRSWPDGFDIQVYSAEVLKKISLMIKDPIKRCHSGWNISQILPQFQKSDIIAPIIEYYPDWNLSLDEANDRIVLDKIFKYFKHNKFSASEAIDYVKKNIDILNINSGKKRKVAGQG